MAYDALGRMEEFEFFGPNEDPLNDDPGINRVYDYAHSGVTNSIDFHNNRLPVPTVKQHVFGYNSVLQRLSSENKIDNVSRTFSYTDRGQLKTEELDYDSVATDNPKFTTTYSYSNDGLLESIQYPNFGSGSNAVTYSYTNRGQLETVDWSSLASTLETREYDPGGRLIDIDRPHFDEVRTYDAANRLMSISNLKTGNAAADQVGKLTYTYDDYGNKKSESWSEGPTGMSDWDFTTVSTGSGDYLNGFDDEDRLRRFTRGGSQLPSDLYMDRDAPTPGSNIGNIKSLTDSVAGGGPELTGTRGYSDVYELTNINSSTANQSYNFEGQLTQSHAGVQLEWDAAARVKKAVLGPTSVGIEGTHEYGYDCDGRRIWKKVLDLASGNLDFTVYGYGGSNCIYEVKIDQSVSPDTARLDKEFVYRTTIDELLMVDLPATASRSIAAKRGVTRNQQWSVMSVYNMASRAIFGRFNYSVFGKRYAVNTDGTIAANQNADFEIPYGYTSRRHDPESGLAYFRARFYDPATGEFISQDPLQYVDGMSLYRGYFVLNGLDPLGLFTRPCPPPKECKCKKSSFQPTPVFDAVIKQLNQNRPPANKLLEVQLELLGQPTAKGITLSARQNDGYLTMLKTRTAWIGTTSNGGPMVRQADHHLHNGHNVEISGGSEILTVLL